MVCRDVENYARRTKRSSRCGWYEGERKQYKNHPGELRPVILVLASFLSLALNAQAAENKKAPLSVCEVIAHKGEYNRRMIAVRGAVKGGGHGAWLTATPECTYRLVTKGVEWANIIFLAYPDNQSKIESYHASFPVDWRAIRQAEEEAQRQGFNPDTDYTTETYIGLFLTYPNLENRVSPGVPGALRLGFGPLGEAPAQLLIKTVRDLVVVHGPTR
jgi:hypothetical protein